MTKIYLNILCTIINFTNAINIEEPSSNSSENSQQNSALPQPKEKASAEFAIVKEAYFPFIPMNELAQMTDAQCEQIAQNKKNFEAQNN